MRAAYCEAVARFATHSNPVERPVPSFMLQAQLDDVEADDNYEQLWTRPVGEDLFEVCCIPFFAYDLALGDVVRAQDGVIRSVERRSGNGVVRIAVKQAEDVEDMHVHIHDLLGRLEYLCEWFAPGYVAVSVEPERAHDELFAGIADLGEAVEVERIFV
jgi:Domain of unknown function (DUF4265)